MFWKETCKDNENYVWSYLVNVAYSFLYKADPHVG